MKELEQANGSGEGAHWHLNLCWESGFNLFLGDSNVVTSGIDGSSVLDQIPPKILPKTVKPF